MQAKALTDNIRRLLGPSKKLFFLHIAKCGGISINRALRYRYIGGYERLNARASLQAAVDYNDLNDAFQDDYESVLELREKLLLYFLYEGHAFISGHYGFSRIAHEKFSSDYVFMTILRNPVDRFLSSYFFNSRKNESSPWKIGCSLDEFIETRQARNMGHDFVRLLGGTRKDRKYDGQIAIEEAIENLNRFDIVGVIENSKLIAQAIKKEIGVKVNVGHKNKTPVDANSRRDLISTSTINRIREICRPDIEVYEAAVARDS